MTALQGGMSNEELQEAWRRKLPGVKPSDRELTAFALGVEVGSEVREATEEHMIRLVEEKYRRDQARGIQLDGIRYYLSNLRYLLRSAGGAA
jgi:hypothetical protein